jgi:transcriptional regulator GlxA family with amidase domain
MRFQAAVDQLRSTRLRLAEVAVRTGYVDQAHMSHDVGEFSGMTPGGLRAAVKPTVGEPPR